MIAIEDYEITSKYVFIIATSAMRNVITYTLIPPCDARREIVRALYSAVSGLLAVISRAYPQFLSPVPWNILNSLDSI